MAAALTKTPVIGFASTFVFDRLLGHSVRYSLSGIASLTVSAGLDFVSPPSAARLLATKMQYAVHYTVDAAIGRTCDASRLRFLPFASSLKDSALYRSSELHSEVSWIGFASPVAFCRLLVFEDIPV